MTDPYRTPGARPPTAIEFPAMRVEIKIPTMSECMVELARRLEQDPSPANIAAAATAMRQGAEVLEKALAFLERLRAAAPPPLPVPGPGRRRT